jgi:hypothetical protein
MFEELLQKEKKKPSVAQIYYALRAHFGGKIAEEIMDNLEGNKAGYEQLVNLVIENRLDELIE